MPVKKQILLLAVLLAFGTFVLSARSRDHYKRFIVSNYVIQGTVQSPMAAFIVAATAQPTASPAPAGRRLIAFGTALDPQSMPSPRSQDDEIRILVGTTA